MTNNYNRCKSYARIAGLAAVLLCWAGAGSRPARAQKPTADAIKASQVEQASPADIDAERGALDRFLDAHPEIQNDVLSEPQRISDPNYVHDRPELQAFLESHPQVKADPRSFLSPAIWRTMNRRNDTEELFGWLVPFAVFVVCLVAVIWVLRYVLENRRWNKTFKVHEEVHSKLIEKFASGQELTAYMESEAGRRLLEWTPPAIDMPSRGIPAAAGRIIWSLMTGLILVPAGIGLLVIRSYMPDAVEPLLVFGTLGLTIGAGFILSALVSYGLSKQLGLLNGTRQAGASLAGR
jgi:hypothetical protein